MASAGGLSWPATRALLYPPLKAGPQGAGAHPSRPGGAGLGGIMAEPGFGSCFGCSASTCAGAVVFDFLPLAGLHRPGFRLLPH